MHALALLLALVAQDAPAEGTFDVSGTVFDQEGQPLGEVTVVAVTHRGASAVEEPMVRKALTDARGRFQLDGLAPGDGQAIGVYALKHGYVAKFVAFSTDDAARPMDWKLEPAAGEVVQILTPDGSPVANAKAVEIIFGGRDYLTLTEQVLNEFPFRSDAEGRLKIDVVPGRGVNVSVVAPKFGRQRGYFEPETKDRTLRLQPVGSLAGKVVPPEGLSAMGTKVLVEVRSLDNPYTIANDKADVSADHTFHIPAIMAGAATVRVIVDPQKELRPGEAQQLTITTGKESDVTLPLVRAVRITGAVVEQDTDSPIGGAKVSVWNNASQEHLSSVVTDEGGRYAALVGPGRIQVSIAEVPLPFYVTGLQRAIVEDVESGTPAAELPPLSVPRGKRREGIVVDEAGKPVPEAWVTASWWEERDRAITVGGRAVQADERGRFVLEGVASQVEIYLRADSPTAAGLEYTAIPIDKEEGVCLTVSPKGVAVLAGRVVDAQGEPIEGVVVQINAGYRRTSNSRFFTGTNPQLEWKLTTDANGRFVTPQAVPRHLPQPGRLAQLSNHGYYLRAASPGLLDGIVTVVVGPEGEPFVIPDIVLLRERRVAGRVLDRQGKPLAGARVEASGLGERETATVRTDATGRFTLAKVHPEANFFFASRDGFVFTGAPIPADDGDMTIVLSTREEAANDPPLAPRQPTPDESAAALKQILVPLWDKLDPREHAYQRGEILQRMAAHDPEWTVAKLAELGGPRYAIPVLQKLGRTDDALIAVTALRGSYERSYTLVDIARDIPAPDRRQALIGEAFAEARSVIEPTNRLAAMMKIAEALRDFGEHDAARRIVEENLPEIEKLEAGFYRGHIAETVALFNLDKALKLCEGATDEYERDRHPGNIAHKLAGIDPDKAERAYNLVSDRNQYRYVPRVCYRMAPVDLPRAKAIAEAASKTYGDQRPYVYGVMALALAHNNPPEARKLLRQAFELMHGTDPRSDDRRRFQAALALMRIAEIVDPTATRECFWRAASLAPGTQMRTAYEWEAEQKLEYNAMLAVLLTRYGEHPEIARRMVEPLYTSDKLKASQMREGVFPIAMAMIDPAKAANWLQEKYFAETKPDERRYIPQPQELMADAVGGDDEALWKALHDRVLHLWLPDEVD